ncbi:MULTISPECIES: hypothetical protein [unclassified Streptomyces]|uniref:hypothetical protein n=1 Tax=unclassified Streptomyces TaxID=2593676 RepID=UPI000372BBBE|nr:MULTISPECIES: hypothetical protein [unclassified Streptomyces]MYT28017.1 hypothetical protein [Streptomyces sp. SID8354]
MTTADPAAAPAPAPPAEPPAAPLRTLFCLGVTQDFFAADDALRATVAAAIPPAFDRLGERFGVRVLGTLDDDRLMVGASTAWPWTSYVLADVPDLETVSRVCGIVRDTPVGDSRLWRYLRFEARVGRPLFFGTA